MKTSVTQYRPPRLTTPNPALLNREFKMFDRCWALFIIIWCTRFIERATPTFSAAERYLQDTHEWNRVRDLAIFML